MSAQLFINRLESLGLLDPDVIQELKRQVEQSKYRVKPETLAKVLVENGQLTRFQATKLIAESSEEEGDVAELEAELDLMDDSPGDAATDGASTGKAVVLFDGEDDDDVVDVAVVDDIADDEGADDEPVEVVAIDDEDDVPVVAIVEEDGDRVGSHGADGDGGAKGDSGQAGTPASTGYVKPVRPDQLPGKNSGKGNWDSLRIYGALLAFLFLLVPLGFLGYWFFRGNADDYLERAQKQYESQDYESAQKTYETFVDTFAGSEEFSFAKVRVVLANLRNTTGRNADPTVASTLAAELLPSLVSEEGLESQRGDLADILIEIADKFTNRADSAKSTEDKRGLVDALDRHYALIDNRDYFAGPQLAQNANNLSRIEENRARIVRDIQRADDLVVAVKSMQEELENNEVTAAYTIREQLVSKHPRLAIEPQIEELVLLATSKQQALVETADSAPKVITDLPAESRSRSALLASRDVRSELPDDKIVFIRARGSLYALQASNGKTLWRHYVGVEFVDEPIAIENGGETDLLLPLRSEGLVQRLNGRDGTLKWQAEFGAPILQPLLEEQSVFAAVTDGRVYALDVETGDTKWGKKLPQPIEVGVGPGVRGKTVYVPGEHSNLYALSQTNGECLQVAYVGHQRGAVQVPTVFGSNHVFLFDNAGPNLSFARFFRTDGEGLNLRQQQLPERLLGHVVVTPQKVKRRLTVVTDLGEIQVLDVELDDDKNQVRVVGKSTASSSEPKAIWPLVEPTTMWVASDRFARYTIQVTTQKVFVEEIFDDGDQFLGRPIKAGDFVIHTRIVRGTQGARVSAVDGMTGKIAWQTDLGVPIPMLKLTDGNLPVSAVSSQAAMFSIAMNDLTADGAADAIENPGRFNRELMFDLPVTLADGSVAIVNRADANQLVSVSADGQSIKVLKTAVSRAKPTCDPIVVNNAVVIGLDNGQIVALNPATGQNAQTPFQPTLEPGQNVKWLTPALLSDGKTLVAADNRKRLYRLGSGSQLTKLSEVVVDSPMTSRLAAIGDTVVGVAQLPSGDAVRTFNGLDLSQNSSLQLGGRVLWGPYTIDNQSIVLSDTDGLVAIDQSGKEAWRLEFSDLSLRGAPIPVENDLLLVGGNGQIHRLAGDGSSILGSIDLGEPIEGAPILLGSGMLVPGADGAIFATAVPK
jgi:outer membrane protein assembly factor BamB